MPRGRSFGLAHAAEHCVHVRPESLPLLTFLLRQPGEGAPRRRRRQGRRRSARVALARLPDEERKQWERFWSNVDAMLRRVSEPK